LHDRPIKLCGQKSDCIWHSVAILSRARGNRQRKQITTQLQTALAPIGALLPKRPAAVAPGTAEGAALAAQAPSSMPGMAVAGMPSATMPIQDGSQASYAEVSAISTL
jgi:hypothetical protein